MILAKPSPKDIKKFILEWADKYKNKFNIYPNICRFHPSLAIIDKKIGDILMISNKYTPKSQFWFSWRDNGNFADRGDQNSTKEENTKSWRYIENIQTSRV